MQCREAGIVNIDPSRLEKISCHDSPGSRLSVKDSSCQAGSFPTDHGRFAGTPPHVASKGAGRLDYPVTWNQKRHRIAPDCRTYRPGRASAAQTLGNASIGSQLPHGDFQQRFPYLELKGRSLEMQFYFGKFIPVIPENQERVLLDPIRLLPEGGPGKAGP